MTDQNRKTLRSFYCRDYLWEHFEQMAQELGCSMDYLINESMRLYARNRDQSPGGPEMNQQTGRMGAGPGGGAMGGNPSGPMGGDDHLNVGGFGRGDGDPNMNHRTFQRVPAVNNRGPQGPGGLPPQRGAGGPPPPPPRPGPGPSSGGGNWQQNQPSPPQAPGNFGGDPGMGAGSGPIYLSFNNNRYVIDKDKYVIGRGSKQTDLTIRDGNISRKHCAVLFRNGSYYIKDLDSTNGIEYRGNRIESKKIEEGDVFYLCDYELRFSYRG